MGRRGNLWLLVIVAVCVLSLWFGRDSIPLSVPGTSGTGTRGTQEGPQKRPEDPAKEAVHLLILNGTDHGGLAAEFSLLVRRVNCLAESVGNAPADSYPASFLVNRRLEQPRAEALAKRFGGIPLLREWDRRGTEDAVLVLGQDWPALQNALEP